MAEIRLAGARTVAEANQVLWEFLSRFNERFGVPPAQSGLAYRPVDSELDLAAILCFNHCRKVARDNTVKYKWHTLQLLPEPDRPSYAGARVEVQERLDGRLVVCYQGRLISSQAAPPRPGILRASNGIWGRETTTPLWLLGGLIRDGGGGQGPGYVGEVDATREWVATGGPFSACAVDARCPATHGSSPPPALLWRQPTPRQQARWNAVQAAKGRGLSLRAIARQLGISRNTVRKYVAVDGPPVYPPRVGLPQRPLTKSLISKP